MDKVRKNDGLVDNCQVNDDFVLDDITINDDRRRFAMRYGTIRFAKLPLFVKCGKNE